MSYRTKYDTPHSHTRRQNKAGGGSNEARFENQD